MNIAQPTSIQRGVLSAVLSTRSEEDDDAKSRDIFIQSQTGSGKTLSFLLPIIQDLLPLSSNSYIDRSIGTLAIIIAPTRELAKQISDVLEALLQLRLRSEDESAEDASGSAPRLTRWLVSGLLTGGGTRTHEKARLRKGLPIIVSTPGRLLDHLQNTSSFNVGKCRWLVLDEADRLMELGFEETITGIIQGLDGRRKLAIQAVEAGKSMEVGGWDWDSRRRTVLCSATIREDVQKLAGKALNNPVMIKATEADPAAAASADQAIVSEKMTPPSQLSQKYLVVPLKMRLVALVALLRSLISQSQGRRGTKIIVFLSCTDSVDFHFKLLAGATMSGANPAAAPDSDEDEDSGEDDQAQTSPTDAIEVKSPLLPETSIFRLHGSLPTPVRLASLRGFSGKGTGSSSILLCTSVASRGLDLPLVRAVVQYDLPTEGGATEYVHRVGRTARAGKGGEAWSMVAPSESEWVKWVEKEMRGSADDKSISLSGVSVERVLQDGFGGKGAEYETRATEVQLAFERWVLRDKQNAEYARKGFLSHMRAYATHPSSEKHIFHVRHLHLGHLAKAFALRDAPKSVSAGADKNKTMPKPKESDRKPKQGKVEAKAEAKKRGREWEVDHSGDAERRMQEIVRSQGRLTKKGGVMTSSGVSEFQIAGGAVLERLVNPSGGGIGGLSLAVALSRYPHIKVDVYEAAERFQEIGAGLTIWRRTWRVLELLGLADDFKNIADKKPSSEIDIGFEYRRSDLPEGFNLALLKVPYGGLNFHRAHFLDMLVKHLPSDAAHFGKRVLSYSKPEDGGQTTIAFADGTNATCDVLVGCDGVKSVVRRQMLQSRAETDGRPDLVGLIEPCWSGAIAYRGLVPSSELESAGAKHRTLDRPVIYCGQNKHIVAYTVARGQLVNVVAFATNDYNSEYTDYGAEWVASCSKEEVLESYRGWEPEVQALLQKIDNPTKWCIPCLRPLPLYVSDRVALLGDAAHAMTPHLGAGAGQAIEDAYILATALGAAKKSTIDEALKAYEATRLPIANRVLTDARETGRMYEFHGVYGQDDAAVGPAIVRQYEKTISGTPEREATIVLDMINKTSALTSAKL